MKTNLYDEINPTWLSDATQSQKYESTKLKDEIVNQINLGGFFENTNVTFQEYVSRQRKLLREDRLELYRIFREYKVRLTQKTKR